MGKNHWKKTRENIVINIFFEKILELLRPRGIMGNPIRGARGDILRIHMSQEKKTSYLPLKYWLFNRDPFNGFIIFIIIPT